MKATELMIGDWVMWRSFEFTEPKQIGGTNDKMVRFSGCSFWEVIDAIQPIPLTAEILEKNGWSEDAHHFPEDENVDLELEVQGSEVWWTINLHEYDIIRLSYVHELQHALRLCKIEKEIVL